MAGIIRHIVCLTPTVPCIRRTLKIAPDNFSEPGTAILIHPNPQIKKPPQGWFDYLVEMGGIEPPSASTPPSALHAYFVY